MKNTVDSKRSQRTCPECGCVVIGRRDKIFCSIECKNEYHNGISKAEKDAHNMIFRTLSSNFKILKKCIMDGRRTVSLRELEEMGFRRDTFTGFYHTWTGFDQYSCLGITYVIDNGNVFKIEWEER